MEVEHRAEVRDELPAPSAELVLWRVTVEAIIASQPRKRSERMLHVMAEILASEESVSDVMPIRPSSDAADVQRSRRLAVRMFRQTLPVFMGMLARE